MVRRGASGALLLLAGIPASFAQQGYQPPPGNVMVGFTVVQPNRQYGCMPAMFSAMEVVRGNKPLVIMYDTQAVCDMAPESSGHDAARALELKAQMIGKVVFMEMLEDWNPWVAWSGLRQCSPYRAAQEAAVAGAAAVVLVNKYPNQVPYLIEGSTSLPPILIPVCNTWASTIQELLDQNMVNAQNSGAALVTEGQAHHLRVNFDNFRLWSLDDEVHPAHTITALQILNPVHYRYDVAVGASTFNPHNLDPIVGQLAPMRFSEACMMTTVASGGQLSWDSWQKKCPACFAQPLDPEYSVADKIGLVVLEQGMASPCFPSFFEISYLAQQAGARAVIMASWRWSSLILLTPYVTPFHVTIPTLNMQLLQARALLAYLENPAEKLPLVVRTPEFHSGSGEPYLAGVDAADFVDETVIKVEKMAGSSAGGGVTEMVTFRAGQATFNPRAKASVVGTVVTAPVLVECGDRTHCGRCHEMAGGTGTLDADGGSIFQDPGSLQDKVILVPSANTYCLQSYLEIRQHAHRAGAIGVLITNELDITFNMVDAAKLAPLPGEDDLPMFNLPQKDSLTLQGWVQAQTIRATLPQLEQGVGAPWDPRGHNMTLPPTQIKVQSPPWMKGSYMVGQSLFNPVKSDFITAQVQEMLLHTSCSNLATCHLCHELENITQTELTGRIALVDLSKASCFHMKVNLVLYAQLRGAVGVLFVNLVDAVSTLPPSSPAFEVTIPCFNLMANHSSLFRAQSRGMPIMVRLPTVTDGVASWSEKSDQDVGFGVATTGIDGGSRLDESTGGQKTEEKELVDFTSPEEVAVFAVVLLVAVCCAVSGTFAFIKWRSKKKSNYGKFDMADAGTQTNVGLVPGAKQSRIMSKFGKKKGKAANGGGSSDVAGSSKSQLELPSFASGDEFQGPGPGGTSSQVQLDDEPDDPEMRI